MQRSYPFHDPAKERRKHLFDEAAPPPNFRCVKKQTAHLLSQMGGRIAIRHHGGITPEAELLWL
jgi:hypothetical protein